MAVLAVERLTLTRFRSYRHLRLDLDARPVALSGPNGAGKTNLLEAVSLLAPGRGLRNARLADVQQVGSAADGGWAVAATLVTPDGPVDIGTGVDKAPVEGERERRLVRIDGIPARGQTALADHVVTVWLTPQMDRLFQEGAATRRRFLDRLVFGFDPAHAGRLNRFEHALRERSRLLRDGPGDPAWLSALEAQMAATGVAVAAARRETVGRLGQAARRGVGPFPAVRVAMDGDIDRWLEEFPALDVEELVKKRLMQSRNNDAAAGGALVGPHRSDFVVGHAERDLPAAQCSTGEQKAMLIGLVLADARLLAADHGAPPLLLLDEVAAHLDEDRREALFAEVLALGCQAWLTGAEARHFQGFGGAVQRLSVDAATVTAEG